MAPKKKASPVKAKKPVKKKPAKVAKTKPAAIAATVAAEDPTEKVVEAKPVAPVIKSKNLQVNVSDSLLSKLRLQAEDECLSLGEYVGELLAESVVLRAWEIVERRAQMQGGNQQQHNHNQNRQGGNHGNQRGGGRRNNRRGGMSNNRYNNIMEDSSSFLEYVRNQERNGR